MEESPRRDGSAASGPSLGISISPRAWPGGSRLNCRGNSLVDALELQGAESPGAAASGPECDTKHLCQSKGQEARLLRHQPRDSPFTPLMWL